MLVRRLSAAIQRLPLRDRGDLQEKSDIGVTAQGARLVVRAAM